MESVRHGFSFSTFPWLDDPWSVTHIHTHTHTLLLSARILSALPLLSTIPFPFSHTQPALRRLPKVHCPHADFGDDQIGIAELNVIHALDQPWNGHVLHNGGSGVRAQRRRRQGSGARDPLAHQPKLNRRDNERCVEWANAPQQGKEARHGMG